MLIIVNDINAAINNVTFTFSKVGFSSDESTKKNRAALISQSGGREERVVFPMLAAHGRLAGVD